MDIIGIFNGILHNNPTLAKRLRDNSFHLYHTAGIIANVFGQYEFPDLEAAMNAYLLYWNHRPSVVDPKLVKQVAEKIPILSSRLKNGAQFIRNIDSLLATDDLKSTFANMAMTDETRNSIMNTLVSTGKTMESIFVRSVIQSSQYSCIIDPLGDARKFREYPKYRMDMDPITYINNHDNHYRNLAISDLDVIMSEKILDFKFRLGELGYLNEITAATGWMQLVDTFVQIVNHKRNEQRKTVKDLDKIFEILVKFHLRISLKKCSFGKKSIQFLGHILYVVGSNTIKPMHSKVESIKNWKQPSSLKEVRSFIGLVNYYREIIPNLSVEMIPLFEFIKIELVITNSSKSELFKVSIAFPLNSP
eukprot:gene10426-12804_t